MAKKKKKTADLIVNANGSVVANKNRSTEEADLVVNNGKVTVNKNRTIGRSLSDDIAPVKTSTKRSWFDSGLFDDGYDLGDITKTILGTAGDVGLSVMRGVGNAGEGVGSLIAGGVAQAADWLGQDEYADKVRNRLAGKDEETNKFLEKFGADSNYKRVAGTLGVDDTSLLGEKSKDLGASAGNLFGAMAGQAIGIPWYLTMGGSAAGSELENAYKSGATDGEAWLSAGVSGVSEVLIEKLTGGISFGGKTLDDLWKKPLTKAITNKTANVLAKFGLDMAGEGAEEVLTEAVQSLGRLSYEHDKTWEEALFSEESLDNYLEAFIGGAVLGGGFNVKKAYNSVKTGRDYDTGLTDNEQKVVNSEITNRTTEIQKQRAVEQQINRVIEEREKTFGTLNDTEKRNIKKQIQERLDNGELDYSTTELSKKEITKIESEVMEDLKNGSFSIDKIEDALVGDKTARLRELNQTLTNTTDEAKKAEIEAEINQINVDKATQLKELLSKDVILQESYRQESLKKQEFTREVAETDSDITKELIESAKAVKMNNTRKMHNLFEYTNKIANDSGTKYGFVNNDQLKELGHDVEGKTVNGLVRVNKDGSTKVLINVDSDKAINTIIGHETTHLLEDTKEYKALQKIVKEYATTKGEYDGRFKDLSKLYEGTNADVESEVTADLVGDYLFTDEEFINNLSAKEPNVFKKVYDYIKHAFKMATAGSKEARQLEQVKRRFDKAYKEMSKTTTGKKDSNLTTEADSDTKYSLNDSQGRELTKEQQEYFKDSQARDENGSLATVYHGTNNAGFTVFKRNVNFYTDSKDVAGTYTNKDGVYEGYLNIKNPLVIDADGEKWSRIDVAQVDPAVVDLFNEFGVSTFMEDGAERTSTADIVGAVEDGIDEGILDYDGIIFKNIYDEGMFGNVKAGTLKSNVYVTFNSNQFKNADNTKPTSDPDIRFSLSAPVEETKKMVAWHNMSVEGLQAAISIGGLAMPSFAVKPEGNPHLSYGEVSVIAKRDDVEPSKNVRIFGGDAWTPDVGDLNIHYKINDKAINRINRNVRELIGDVDLGNLGLDETNAEDQLNRWRGNVYNAYGSNVGLRYAYLKDKGIDVSLPTRETSLSHKIDNEGIKYIVEHVSSVNGADEFERAYREGITYFKEHRDVEVEAIREVVNDYYSEKYGSIFEEKEFYTKEKFGFSDWDSIIRGVQKYRTDGIKTAIDTYAAKDVINEKVDEAGFKKWFSEQFDGVIEKTGIRNEKELFTPSGNRRSFESLHWEYNLANIVKALKGKDQQGKTNFLSGIGSAKGAALKDFKSIEDVRNSLDRIVPESKVEETKEAYDAFNERVGEIASIVNPNDMLDGASDIAEILAKNKTKSGILRYLAKEFDPYYHYDNIDLLASDLYDLIDLANKLPMEYFEAKLYRAYGFDEPVGIVVPDSIDEELFNELKQLNNNVLKYEAGNDADRVEKVNSLSDAKFSLSAPGEAVAPVGNYNVYGRDVKLQEDIAPVKETISETETVEDIAPVKTVEPEEDDELSRPLTEEDLYLVEQERDEAFRNISDDYLPAEESEYYNAPDTSPIDDDYLRLVTKNMRQGLGLKNNQMAAFRKIVQDFSTSEDQSLENLYAAIEKEFGTVNEKKKLEDVATIKATLRSMRIKVSDTIKGDIPDYAKWKQKQFGKIRITNDGMDVDDVYEGLKDYFPDFFPSDIINPTDQLLRIAEVMDMDATVIEEYALPEEQIQDVTDFIYEAVYDYKQQKRRDDAIAASKAPIDESMIPYDETLSKKDIAPVKSNFDSHDFTVSRGVQQKYDLESGEITENERDAEIERLERKKKQALEDLGDLPTFTKRKANELYDEVRMMTKGQRVSTDLGFILDRMFSGVSKQDPDYETIKDGIYKNITDALLNIEMNPVQPETSRPYAETIIRNAIEKRYTWTVDDINSWELDPVSKTRRELRKALIGQDPDFLDKALETAKNVPMALMNNTDTIRNTELVFGRKNGKVINDLIFQKAIDNESKSIAWQNKERAEIAALGIKAKDKYGRVTKESEAVQKYGEGKYLDDTGDYVIYDDAALERDFPNPDERAKIIGAARAIREKYDNYIDTANDVLTSLGFEAIPKRDDYFRHFQALNDVFSNFGIPFNPESMAEHTLPTDINGLTEFWSPQKNYFANIQPRKGMRTTLDAITGIDGYISGIANLIYHTEDIQRGRALEDLIRETYGEAKGWDNLASLPEEQQAARAEKIQDNHLSNYAAWVHEWTNNMAGKKNKIDRSVESMFGRKAFSFLDETRKQVGSNMIGLNLASSLTNLISPVQAMAKTNKLAVAKGTADTIKNIFVKDTFMEDNSFLTARMGTDMLSKTAWEKMRDAGYVFMKGMDWFSSNQIVRSKFYELKAKGMSDAEAHAEAGKFAARIMGDRTKGANAQLYNSKLVGLVTQFQLEVNNQLYSMFYDTYHESKENAKNDARKTAAGMTFTLGQLFAFTHLFGKTFESIAGYNPTFDVIGILATALGAGDDDEDKPVSERLKEASDKLVDALPYVNILTGGGRIPITSGIPNVVGVMTGGKDDYGNELTWEDELKKLLYLVPPTGGGQIKKTAQGLAMFDSDNPVTGSYTDSGNLRFPVENTPLNVLQAGVFGQWSSENARNYFDNERKPLGEKQIQEYKDLDIPIADYWKYREDLKGKKKLEDKFDYIADLDLPVAKKNIMINNIVDRKEAVDMTDYDQFASYEEFDWATKNPEKYSYLESIGVSYKQYKASDEAKDAYNWAYENPEKYSLAKAAAGDVVKYRSYVSELNDIKADKNSSGKSISGSRKTKVANYINGLDADYGSKLVLFKSEYPSDDTYNNEIIEYLNNRQDISYDEMVAILRELDFNVSADGYVTW